MKRYGLLFLIVSLVLSMALGSTTVFAKTNEEYEDSSTSNVQVVTVTDVELMNMTNVENLTNHIDDSGIVVVRHSKYTNSQIASKLKMALTITEQGESQDIASIYYTYGGGKQGIYIISGNESETLDIDGLIAEGISIIQDRQANRSTQSINSIDSATSLGFVDVTTAVEPKGKLRASYEIFTVQNYHDLDFYIVKANISGLPGCVLASDNGNYKKAYQIEELSATISTPTTSTSLDAYGPHRTIDSSSYSVDVGLSVDSEGTIGISGGWSYSRNIEDTDIDASCTDKKAYWDITLEDDAQKNSFTFEPSASFKCPYNKASVQIDVSASCVFDSWFAFEETVSLNRTIICTPSSLSDN